MEDNKTYFGEIGHGLKTLAVGMKTSWKEYFKDFFTNKSTEQYPENRKTTLHVAKRHRGRLGFRIWSIRRRGNVHFTHIRIHTRKKALPRNQMIPGI